MSTGRNTGTEPACANPSGAIARVTPGGQVTTVVSGLPSINNGTGNGPGVAGPSGITVVNGKIQFLIQNENINSTTGDTDLRTGRCAPGKPALGSALGRIATSEAYLGAVQGGSTTPTTVREAALP